MKEEKSIHRIIAQSPDNKITISAQTFKDVTHEEAVKAAVNDVLFAKPLEGNYSNFIIQSICSENDWKEGVISFCPRCGTHIGDYEVGKGGSFDCHNCNASVEAYVNDVYNDED